MKDYYLFIPFVNRPDLLRKAVESVKELNPKVVDNSPDRTCASEVLIERPCQPLTFAQTMNFGLSRAAEDNRKYCLFMHSDASAVNGTGMELLERCRAADDGVNGYSAHYGSKWGGIFTNYDAFVAFNVAACKAIGPWDTNLPQYFADNDYYRRMKLAGYAMLESGLEVNHTPSQTINSDPKLKFLNSVTFPLYRQYYTQKWGGEPGQETFVQPFNGRC
jgi:glycosyltransferase involved in cell wall biosynthesis